MVKTCAIQEVQCSCWKDWGATTSQILHETVFNVKSKTTTTHYLAIIPRVQYLRVRTNMKSKSATIHSLPVIALFMFAEISLVV